MTPAQRARRLSFSEIMEDAASYIDADPFSSQSAQRALNRLYAAVGNLDDRVTALEEGRAEVE